jgi:glutamyl-Q tRNA(Asp) synthetase
MTERCRFAPSTTGEAHAGTLLAALLAWLDARARKAHLLLRLEDIDPERCRPEFGMRMQADLSWLGLDFDIVEEQHTRVAAHEEALDRLAAAGLLYPCECTRSRLRSYGRRAADGGFVYPNNCRGRALPPGGWRAAREPLRFRVPDGPVRATDESGLDLSQHVAVAMGDPIVRRRDGAIAYQLAVVVDDAAAGISRIVRGRDLAPSTPTQVALQRALGLTTPAYRHHFLLLEPQGDKLAKLHGAVSTRELRRAYEGPSLLGFLAWVAGLTPDPEPMKAHELCADFTWSRVCREDCTVSWNGSQLTVTRAPAMGAASRYRRCSR